MRAPPIANTIQHAVLVELGFGRGCRAWGWQRVAGCRGEMLDGGEVLDGGESSAGSWGWQASERGFLAGERSVEVIQATPSGMITSNRPW